MGRAKSSGNVKKINRLAQATYGQPFDIEEQQVLENGTVQYRATLRPFCMMMLQSNVH